MANPYLIKALYGPKTSTPAVADQSTTSSSSATPTTTPQSLATREPALHLESAFERATIRGKPATAGLPASVAPNLRSPAMFNFFAPQKKTKEAEYEPEDRERMILDSVVKPEISVDQMKGIHQARLQRMESEDHSGEKVKEEAKWKPTGSNVLPVGRNRPGSVAVTAPSSTPSETKMSSIASLEPTVWPPKIQQKAEQMYPAIRYLPPSGEYYEQAMLPAIFGCNSFARGVCSHCWTTSCPNRPRKGALVRNYQCTLPCGVCGKRDHQGKTCPMVYCTKNWHDERGSPVPDQIRPTLNEAKLLVRIGLIHPISKSRDLIVPVMSHCTAQIFYKDGPPPKVLGTGSGSTALSAMQNQHPTGPRLAAPSAPVTGNSINAALDPRLRNRAIRSEAAAPPIKLEDPPSHSTINQWPALPRFMDVDMDIDAGHGSMVEPESEIRIQELEDKVLGLQHAMAAKDREIRKLKADNENLRLLFRQAEGTEVGSKRPRLGL